MGNLLASATSIFLGTSDTVELNVSETPAHPAGSKVCVYKQYPSVSYVGRRVVWLPVEVRQGPETDSVSIVMPGLYRDVEPTDDEGNFLYDPYTNPEAFDAVHTLAVVEKVRLMFRRTLGRQNWIHLQWQWGSREPLRVRPHAGERRNAFYQRSDKSLNFFYFSSDSDGGGDGEKAYTCRSWDTVAHETGHAVLDGLQPGWIEPLYESTQRGALHEAFGDLTAIFSVLDQFDMCELVVAHTKADLRDRRNLLAVLSEEFAAKAEDDSEGPAVDFGLRNAADNLKMSDAHDEYHDLSRVFTGAVYDVIVRIFEVSLNAEELSPAETLYNVGKYVLGRFLFAIMNAPSRKVTFADVATLMIENEPVAKFKDFIREEFERREVFDSSKKPKHLSLSEQKKACCCMV